VPAVGVEAGQHVLAPRQRRVALDGDVVVVEDADQAAQSLVAGQAGRLGGDALLQVAVRAEDVGRAVEDPGALSVPHSSGVPVGDRHADGVAEALAQRAGGGLHAWRVAVLGVTRRAALVLAERLQVVERQRVAGEKSCE
jgi:hypothetical protein